MFRLPLPCFSLFVLLLPLVFLCAASASDLQLQESTLNTARKLNLSNQDQWLYLNHYRNKPTTGKQESYIDDPEFFISPEGKYSSDKELSATINVFLNPESKNPKGEYYRCRYQARYQWLKQKLNLDIPFDIETRCALFNQWYSAINPGSVTLIYPTSYINSPSSMFGHTLLRIDPPSSQQQADLISWAINFGADVGANSEQDLFYAYKGLAGGYPGQFVIMPYHKKVKEYSKIENRDIWEYRLNLSQKETEFMVLHLWEINNSNFDYYYLDENCSFRLMELLDVARPSLHVSRAFPIIAIPNDTVRIVVESKLVKSKKYRPSSVNAIKKKLEQLENNEKRLTLQLTKDTSLLEDDNFKVLPADRQHLIIEAAYQHLRYQQLGKDRDRNSAQRSWKLLSALNKSGNDRGTPITPKPPVSPDLGHRSSAFSFSLGQVHENNFIGLKFRPAYHGLTDSQKGFLHGAEINFFDIGVRFFDDEKVKIDQFDLFKIISLSPRNQFFPEWSWKVSAGLEHVAANTSAFEREIFIDAGGGAAVELIDNHLSYGLFTARAEYNSDYSENIDILMGVEIGHLWYQRVGVFQLELRSQYMS
ncbi:MAG: DUF4105 domain-containing protein, partial [Pseudomonadales bacterium]|nr:DUF4105 domain-containing protein [Pseudomonadales bacterium]